MEVGGDVDGMEGWEHNTLPGSWNTPEKFLEMIDLWFFSLFLQKL
jgi:hypothetical protein